MKPGDDTMKNLEQIRAAGAEEAAPNTTKQAVSKLPAMILTNGLLAAAAFASEKKRDGTTPRRPAMKAAFDGAARHLARREIIREGCRDIESAIRLLSAGDSSQLQRATAETLAFIGYVKRFATREGDEEGREEP